MQEFNIGQDETSAQNLPDGCEWVVIEYENFGWEGGGWAVAKNGEALIVFNLSHCSCYGPFEHPEENKTVTLDQWKSDELHYTNDLSRKMIEKVNSLLNWHPFATTSEEDVRYIDIDKDE